MKYVVSIFRAANQNWTSRIFSIILIISVTYSIVRITEAKRGGKVCDECEKQRTELIQALIDIKKELSPVAETSLKMPVSASVSFALFDTLKPVKKTQQQQQVQKVLNKIDSVLLKYRIPQKQKQTI